VAALVVAVFWVVLNHMKLGRRIYAVGSNEAAARLSGVRIQLTKWLVYALCGLTAGLAGALMVSRVGGPSANTAQGEELVVISAVVIGGASLSGGQGGIGGCVIGAVLMSALSSACTSFGISDALQAIIIGHFLIGAVAVDHLRRARLTAG
jgi:ribose/xylose/arabinose/galactoside ABC-type transport system permease subunit